MENLVAAKTFFQKEGAKLERGIHILADFYECSPEHPLLTNQKILEDECKKNIYRSGLNQLSHLFHKFPNSGITGVILLTESHFAIHTWPEKNYLTLDIFVCNFFSDNTQKARKLYQLFEDLFKPKYKAHQEVERD